MEDLAKLLVVGSIVVWIFISWFNSATSRWAAEAKADKLQFAKTSEKITKMILIDRLTAVEIINLTGVTSMELFSIGRKASSKISIGMSYENDANKTPFFTFTLDGKYKLSHFDVANLRNQIVALVEEDIYDSLTQYKSTPINLSRKDGSKMITFDGFEISLYSVASAINTYYRVQHIEENRGSMSYSEYEMMLSNFEYLART